jgi:geranylgeranyl pyrophosphate synthase
MGEEEIDIKRFLKEKEGLINEELNKAFPHSLKQEWLEKVLGKPTYVYDSESITESIAKPVWDLLDRGGKRWRPVLMMVCAEAVGGNAEEVKQFTPILELIDNGTVMHDDAEDSSELRRGDTCTYKKFGLDIAINLGSAMYFVPYTIVQDSSLSTEAKNKIYELWMQELVRLHTGQGMDILWHRGQKFDISEEEYLQMCAYKTGTLARFSTKLGAILGNGSEEQIEKLGKFGENVGVAFQIQDDILNLVGKEFAKGKGAGEDIHEGKRTIMVLHSLKNATEEDKKRLLEILNSHPEDQETIREAIEIIKKYRSIDYARAKAKELVENSWKELEPVLPGSSAKKILHAFAKFLINRSV